MFYYIHRPCWSCHSCLTIEFVITQEPFRHDNMDAVKRQLIFSDGSSSRTMKMFFDMGFQPHAALIVLIPSNAVELSSYWIVVVMRFSTIRDLTFQMDPLSRFVSQAACSRWLQNVLCPSPNFGVAFYANRLEACPADSWSTESCSALYND